MWPFSKELRYNLSADDGDLCDLQPVSVDEGLQAFCAVFAGSDAAERVRIRASLSLEEFYTLLTFAKRSAVWHCEKKRLSHVKAGLTAIVMIDRKRVDFRDVSVAMGLLFAAAERIGERYDDIVSTVAEMAEPGESKLMKDILQYPAVSRTFQAKGFLEVNGENGPGLVTWCFGKYKPTLPLYEIAKKLGWCF